MKLTAAEALAGIVVDDEFCADYMIPRALDERVVPSVAKAVARAGDSGVTR